MICPGCGRDAVRIITHCSPETGRVDREGCSSCFDGAPREHVYTGKKIWHAYEAYGVNKTIEKNHEWIKKVGERAARSRRDTAHISEAAFKAIQTGEGIRR